MDIRIFDNSIRVSLSYIYKETAIERVNMLDNLDNRRTNILAYVKDGTNHVMFVTSMTLNLATGYDEHGAIVTKDLKRCTKVHFRCTILNGNFLKIGNDPYLVLSPYNSYPEGYQEAGHPDIDEYCRMLGKPKEELFSAKLLYMMSQRRALLHKLDIPLEVFSKFAFAAEPDVNSLSWMPSFNQFYVGRCDYSLIWASSDELISLPNDKRVLESVLEQGIELTCDFCGAQYIVKNKADLVENYCQACSATIPKCCECSKRSVKTIDGLSVCNDHLKPHHVGGYHSNSSRSEPHFIGEASEDFPLYMGVELELDREADTNIPTMTGLAISHIRKELFADHVDITRDSSLSEQGFELISQPTTLAAWHDRKSIWGKLFKTLIKCGMRGHDSKSAGFHVHVSKNAFDDSGRAFTRLQMLMHRHLDKVLLISRRTENRMNDYAYPVPEMKGIKTFTVDHIEMLQKCKRLGIGGHHMLAVDGEVPTFEFRIFRSTLNIESFMATLDFVEGLCRYANTHDFNACNVVTWDELKVFINSDDFNAYESRIMRQAGTKKEASWQGIENEFVDGNEPLVGVADALQHLIEGVA